MIDGSAFIGFDECMCHDACGSELVSYAWFPIAWREWTSRERSLIPTAFLFVSDCNYVPKACEVRNIVYRNIISTSLPLLL